MHAMDPSSSTRFTHGFADTGNGRIHYAELAGDGPPLVLLHGLGMDWRVWQAVSRRLAPFFHLFMLDLRGHGQSAKPAHGYTLAHYAADVEDVLDHLRLDRVVLVGSSLGGMVAASVEAPPDLVSHFVLVDPPLTGGPIREAAVFRRILELKHQPPEALARFLRENNPGAGLFLLRSMSEMWHEAADGVIEDMLDRPADYYAIDRNLRAIESPTLLMQADPVHGAVLTDTEAQRTLELLRQGSLTRVAGAGHAIHAHAPVEFVRLLTEFAEVGTRGAG
ncbi:MAG: alpha/beta hydrolase [Chloroflexota bacterium]|nr:alpha/beta hydrolase [Chloroflexota bacterium]